jgi:2-keto-4-pentenoate hydratase
MTRQDTIESLGTWFSNAFYTGKFDGDLDFPIRSLSLDDAYRIQDRAIQLRMGMGEQVVGYKVGCTSKAIQQQFGLKEPINGRLMTPHIFEETCCKRLNQNRFLNCAIEPEMVFRIGRDLDGQHLNRDHLIRSIEYVSPGIEIHQFKFWYPPPTSQELIASNGIHAAQLIGSSRVSPNTLDFQTEEFRVYTDSVYVTSGNSSEIMGDPIQSLRWLVSHLAERGEQLRAGDWVIPGSPVELVKINQDTHLCIEIDGVGSVNVRFASE